MDHGTESWTLGQRSHSAQRTAHSVNDSMVSGERNEAVRAIAAAPSGSMRGMRGQRKQRAMMRGMRGQREQGLLLIVALDERLHERL